MSAVEFYRDTKGAVVWRTFSNFFCDLGLSPPIKIAHSCNEHQAKRAAAYVEIYGKMLIGFRGYGFRENETLYEFGVGPGFLAQEFQNQGLNVIGTDITTPGYRLNGKIAVARGSLPFIDKAFDYLSATSVIHHIPQETHHFYFGEFKRLLKPDGVLLIQEDERGKNPIKHTVIRAVDRCVSGSEANSHKFRSEWEQYFLSEGFVIRGFDMITHKKGPLELNKLFFALTEVYTPRVM